MRKLAFMVVFCVLGCFDTPPQVSDDDGDDVARVALSGVVQRWTGEDYEPIHGVRVELVGSPSHYGITNTQGVFTVEGVPANAFAFLATSPSNEFVGSVRGIDVRYADIDEIEIVQLSKLQIEQQMDTLRETDPTVHFDDSLGHVAIFSDTLAATASLDPRPDGAFVYSLSGTGAPLLDDSTFRFFPLPMVVFVNLPLAEASATLQLSVEHPNQTCTVDHGSPPSIANHLTWVSAQCG